MSLDQGFSSHSHAMMSPIRNPAPKDKTFPVQIIVMACLYRPMLRNTSLREDMTRLAIIFFCVWVAVANSAPLFLIAQNPTKTLMLETDSVRRLGMGVLGFSAKAVSNHGYRPAGATETIAIAVTDYEMDCWRVRVKETATRYLTDEDKDAGSAPAINQMWTTIEPGSDFDVVRKKIC